jgi:glucosamine kinase
VRARLTRPDADAMAGALLVARGRLDLPKRDLPKKDLPKREVDREIDREN